MFGKKTAVIVKLDHEDKVEVSPEFQSVPVANHALSMHLKEGDSIVIEKNYNDFDGFEITALERTANPRIWGENEYTVLPSDEV